MDLARLSRLAMGSRHIALAGVGLVLFLAVLWILHRELAGVHFADVVGRFRAVSWSAILLALGFTAASYTALIGYDWLALRHIGRRLPFPGVVVTSFIATAVGHNLGVAVLSGGAVRYRLYTAAGLSAAEVATVIGIVGMTFGLGVSFVLGLIMLVATPEAAQVLHLPAAPVRIMRRPDTDDNPGLRAVGCGAADSAAFARLAIGRASSEHHGAPDFVRNRGRGFFQDGVASIGTRAVLSGARIFFGVAGHGVVRGLRKLSCSQQHHQNQ